MKRLFVFLILCAAAFAQAPPKAILGSITAFKAEDAVVVVKPDNTDAVNVKLTGIAKGFSVNQKQNFEITSPKTLDLQLTIEAESQVVNVEETVGQVSTDPGSNGDALVLHAKELEALSDDPDELAQQLQAMAGPAAGPNGGQISIDGFTGGNLPRPPETPVLL